MSLIDTIRRVPGVVDKVIKERKELTAGLFAYLGDKLSSINEIVLIGSGTSNTCSMTSHEFVEKASGISTTVLLPNLFLEKCAYFYITERNIYLNAKGIAENERAWKFNSGCYRGCIITTCQCWWLPYSDGNRS